MSQSKVITVCLLSGIGNTIMATPLIEALRKIGYKVKFLIHPTSKNLVDMVQGFEYTIGKTTTGLTAIPALWSRCEKGRVSEHQIIADDLNPKKHHEIEANMTIARKLGFKGKAPPPCVYGVKPEHNHTIVIATGCRPEPQWIKKKYPHWAKLCEHLAKDHKLSFLGTARESGSWMESHGVNLCGKMSLKDAINWVGGCRGVVAIDNGISHISAALNKPTNVIYGPTIEAKNRQVGKKVKIIFKDIHCRPCQLTPRWNKCKDYQCVDISPEYILKNLIWR